MESYFEYLANLKPMTRESIVFCLPLYTLITLIRYNDLNGNYSGSKWIKDYFKNNSVTDFRKILLNQLNSY